MAADGAPELGSRDPVHRELEVTPFEETLRTNSVCDPKNALDSIPNWNILEHLHQENEDIALLT